MKKELVLLLADGSKFYGYSFGYENFEQLSFGEICFNTSMTGYQEIITDPSSAGKIIALTYPTIGSYGTNSTDIQGLSCPCAVKGLVVKEYSHFFNNNNAEASLADFLQKNRVVAIEGVDTRALTTHLRNHGTMNAVIAPADSDLKLILTQLQNFKEDNLIDRVSCQKKQLFGEQAKYNVVAYDFGIKKDLLTQLLKKNCRVTLVPANTSSAEVLALNPDGIFLSDGPESFPKQIIENIQHLTSTEIPIFAVGLGQLLLWLALGAKTYKLKFGHHGSNYPVKNLAKDQVESTTQNHSFVLDSLEGLPARITHLHLNDQTVAGVRHLQKPFFSTQHSADYLFEEFIDLMEK